MRGRGWIVKALVFALLVLVPGFVAAQEPTVDRAEPDMNPLLDEVVVEFCRMKLLIFGDQSLIGFCKSHLSQIADHIILRHIVSVTR